ncbi:hypothetical protein J3R82DRAFT_2543 [Butyriboletus roseoflavus]|nr:hypothetical protein J3R82DRAFT_2543 [Butyriboletus roseoflavus]
MGLITRPCGACVKKGYSIDQCIDGCESCRKARVRCEGGKPCQRCREIDQECTDEQITTGTRSDVAPPVFVIRNRQKSERAKLACQNCRRDNKKCDDQRPCSRCIARNEECVHVGRGPKLVKLRCEGCRQENRKCEDARPCKQCVEQGKECVSVQRKGRGHGTRVKAACATCRPCTTCVRKGYQCVDRVCATCVQQGLEGECPHRPGQEADTSDGDGSGRRNGQLTPAETTSGAHHPYIPNHPPLPMPHAEIAPAMFPSHVYGPSAYHLLAAQHPIHSPGEGSSTGYPRAPYYPAIDPQIDAPQPNISSERFDASSAQTSASSGSS